MEHALQFLCELETALDFEFRQHATLCIIRYRTTVQETLRKMALVVALENIFVGEVAEDGNGLVNDGINFGFRFLVIGG